MTDDEYLEEYENLEIEFNDAVRLLKDRFVRENAKYRIGDILRSNNCIIKVVRIYGSTFFSKSPLIQYKGPQLTLKMQPRKDGSLATISESMVEEKL